MKKAYPLLFFLTLLNTLNFVDRQLIASFANFIVPDLGLTDIQYGFLTSLAFIAFYSIMGLFMGVLADTVNRPKLIAFGVVLWSIFTGLTGAAKGFVTMAVPNCEFYEFFPCTGANMYGLVQDIQINSEGMVHAPTEPGLGYTIDWDLVKRERIATIE